jgi:DNA-binding NtrC family response regulator
MSDLLRIDDDPGQLVAQVRQAYPAPGHRIAVAGTGTEGVGRVRAAPPDLVLLSLGLPDQCGLVVNQQIRGLDARVPVIFVTERREAKAAIEAMKQGAYDCLFKPPDPGHLAQVVAEALEIGRWSHEPSLAAEPASDAETGGPLVGTCPSMRQAYMEISLVAAQDFPVIITGETGTGKELVARAIHEHSNRAGSLGSSGEPAPAKTPWEARALESFSGGRLGPDACELYAETHRQVDRLLLPRVLEYTRGSQQNAASLLGIARTTLRVKLREQGLRTDCPGWNRR